MSSSANCEDRDVVAKEEITEPISFAEDPASSRDRSFRIKEREEGKGEGAGISSDRVAIVWGSKEKL